jgi:hypothetical protein
MNLNLKLIILIGAICFGKFSFATEDSLLLKNSINTQLHTKKQKNSLELKVRNDNLGLKGDDIGETHTSIVSYYNMKWSSKYNFMFRWESTEYSGKNNTTEEPRDIFFSEVNNFQIIFDNNKLKNNSFFYTISPGLFYIQSNYITAGATGQKNAFHTYVVSKYYPRKYWIYLDENKPEYYFPYIEIKYGYNKSFFERKNFVLQTTNTAEIQLATNDNFSGLGAKTNANFMFFNNPFHIPEINLLLEGYYQSNLSSYQIAYLLAGYKLNWKHFSFANQLVKPLAKNLDNPYIKYNDMELMITYGIYYYY